MPTEMAHGLPRRASRSQSDGCNCSAHYSLDRQQYGRAIFCGWSSANGSMKTLTNVRLIAVLLISLNSPLYAQAPLLDPNLPSAHPEALQRLSDDRVRQRIMQESQARYSGRCVCQYQTKDSNGRSCKGRHEAIKALPKPVCYPKQVTDEMLGDWRQRHP
jgi:hypothetical protein